MKQTKMEKEECEQDFQTAKEYLGKRSFAMQCIYDKDSIPENPHDGITVLNSNIIVV